MNINLPETSSDKSKSPDQTQINQDKINVLKTMLPIKTVKIIKEKNRRNVFNDLMNIIRKEAQRNEMKKIYNMNNNKTLKEYMDKWKEKKNR